MTLYAKDGKFFDKEAVWIFNRDTFLGKQKLYSGTKSIINDILIWSSNITAILTYFECVCWIFQKYRVSCRLDNYYFLLDWVEYVGNNIFSQR